MSEALALEACRLHVAYEALPADRGGKNGTKGKAWAAFVAARDAALASPPTDPAPDEVKAVAFDLRSHLFRQREWSERTFGPGDRAKGVVDHIRKELLEIEAEPGDLAEWIDVVILALDGAWRAGHSPDAIIAQLVGKQTKNEARAWPDWRTMSPDKAIEHVRSLTGEADGQ